MLQRNDVILRHNFRQGNEVAHMMTKQNEDKETKRKLFVQPPLFVESILRRDQMEEVVFVKNLSNVACNSLVSYGNKCVLGDTIYDCNALNPI